MIGWTIDGRVHHKSSARTVTHPGIISALGGLTSHGIQVKALGLATLMSPTNSHQPNLSLSELTLKNKKYASNVVIGSNVNHGAPSFSTKLCQRLF